MMKFKYFKMLLSGFGLIAFPLNAQAETPIVNPDYAVCFYADANFVGDRRCEYPDVPAGRVTSFARVVNFVGDKENDTYSSVRVGHKVGAFVYSNANGGGVSRTVTANESYVGADWNDKISSFQVLVKPEFFAELEGKKAAAAPPSAPPTVCFYFDQNYSGTSKCLTATGSASVATDRRRQYSSLRVTPGYQVTIFSEVDLSGRACTFIRDTPRLSQVCNDMAQSVIVLKK